MPWSQFELKLKEGLKEERNIVREVNVLVLPQFCIVLLTESSLTLISALSGCNHSFSLLTAVEPHLFQFLNAV